MFGRVSGYPFAAGDPSWSKASFERKNDPTGLNYYPEANNNEPYATVVMIGVQVRQPFRAGGLENTLVFHVPTTELQNIKLSFAIRSNGAAETLLIDYWDGSQWITDDLDSPSKAILSNYGI